MKQNEKYHSSILCYIMDHVMTRRAIITKLEKLVANYYTQVYKKVHMKRGEGQVDECKSKGQLNNIWR